jgi:hypothetical protein
MVDLEIAILALLAVFGALFAAVLGWLDSGEPFNARKFATSVGRAIVAGLLVSLTVILVPSTQVGIYEYISSFLLGAGVDVLGNRAAGVVIK